MSITVWFIAFLRNPFAVVATVILVDSIDMVMAPPPGLRLDGYVENLLSGLLFYGMPPVALSFFTRFYLANGRPVDSKVIPILAAWIGAAVFSAILLGLILLDTPANLLPWLPSTFLAGAVSGGIAGLLFRPRK